MNKKLQLAFEAFNMAKPVALAIGNDWQAGVGANHVVNSPIDGSMLAELKLATPDQTESAIAAAARGTGSCARRIRSAIRREAPRVQGAAC
jgi:acyl-CoA reductase-like NAD-dependent aldehyde dehydrogenase